MNITINGKITNILPKKSGVSSRGNEWLSQDFVIECENGDNICFNVFGADNIAKYGMKIGSLVSATCDVKSKQYKDRWFTSISCISCIVQNATNDVNKTQKKEEPKRIETPASNAQNTNIDIDDFPF